MEMNFIASWRPEAEKFYKNANAQKVAEEVYALGEHPETKEILDMARDSKKEIHKLIEWDDSVAAEKYRLKQVCKVVEDLLIVEITAGEKKPEKIEKPLKMFYSMKGETGYRPTPFIMQNADLHQKLLMTARSELNSFVIKYSVLTELEPVFKAIRELDNKPAA